MITAFDLEGKPIPVSGICPICFDLNRHCDRVYKGLRQHLIQTHGFPARTPAEHDDAIRRRARSHKHTAAYKRGYYQAHRDVLCRYSRERYQKKKAMKS